MRSVARSRIRQLGTYDLRKAINHSFLDEKIESRANVQNTSRRKSRVSNDLAARAVARPNAPVFKNTKSPSATHIWNKQSSHRIQKRLPAAAAIPRPLGQFARCSVTPKLVRCLVPYRPSSSGHVGRPSDRVRFVHPAWRANGSRVSAPTIPLFPFLWLTAI